MRYCGRPFEESEIEFIRTTIEGNPKLSRYKLSLSVCEKLNWRRPDGKLKDMSCRVALLRMQKDGLIQLPAARWAKPVTYGEHPDIEKEVVPPTEPTEVDLDQLSVEIVTQKRDSRLWNAYIQRHHYLGHQLMPGAQLRYFVRAQDAIVAALSFGASAWKVGPRDNFIGWSVEQRQRNLHLIVNNARFLIFPWIRRPNMASKILAMMSRRICDDWQSRYSYRPVLLETFVEDGRFRGTCYKAANWQCLGKTQGRGKLDRYNQYAIPIKSIWIYPLISHFRTHLCREPSLASETPPLSP
jgi:hypothetical protein